MQDGGHSLKIEKICFFEELHLFSLYTGNSLEFVEKFKVLLNMPIRTFDVVSVPLDIVESYEHGAMAVAGYEVITGHLSYQWPSVGKEGLC